jgi:benzoylformate decarboxylase
MVVTVGQQDRRHLIHDPMLGGNLLALAQGAFKDAVEVNQVADLPTLMRRAFLLAQTPPTGPVMVSIPVDVLEEEWDDPLPARTQVRGLGVAKGVEELAEALLAAGAPAIVAGDGVGRAGAVEDLVALAESLGATVFHEAMYDCVDFPATHPLSAGMLPPVDALIEEKLSGHDVVFLVGSHAFSAHYYTDALPIPERTQVLQLDEDRAELGRNYPARIALHGGIGPTVRAITGIVSGRCQEAEARIEAAQKNQAASASAPTSNGERMDPTAAAEALVAGLPEGTIMIEEAITSGLEVRRVYAASRPGSYHHSVGGALGWALGAGIGVKMARPDDPVVSVVGDGTAMYTIQGLWSAAHYDVPLVLIVMNNREYAACKRGIARVVADGGDRYVGMDLTEPEIDFIGLARSLGVEARSADSPDELSAAVSESLASGAPTLVDAAVVGTRDEPSDKPSEHYAADR